MPRNTRSNTQPTRLCSLVSTLLFALAGTVAAAEPAVQVLEGVAVTGLNRRLGQPLQNFGPLLGTFGFETAAAFSPTTAGPLPLTPDSPGSTLLATTVDPAVLEVFDVDPDAIDPAVLNVPLRDVPANVDPAGIVRQPLPGVFSSPPLSPSQAEPADPITLDAWLEARGVAVLRCPAVGPATARLTVRNLLPNRLYTVWAAFLTPDGPRPIPFGGAPNTLSTDERGAGRFFRRLDYCPFRPTVDGGLLLSIDVVLHSDHAVYAVEPALPVAGLPPGVVAHAQLEFQIAGTPIP